MLVFDPTYLRDASDVFNYVKSIKDKNKTTYLEESSYVLNKVESTKDKNNITTFKVQLDYVTLNTRFFYDCLPKFFLGILVYITPITLLVSFISLLFASIDRYVALTFPFNYKQLNSIKIANIVSVAI